MGVGPDRSGPYAFILIPSVGPDPSTLRFDLIPTVDPIPSVGAGPVRPYAFNCNWKSYPARVKPYAS